MNKIVLGLIAADIAIGATILAIHYKDIKISVEERFNESDIEFGKVEKAIIISGGLLIAAVVTPISLVGDKIKDVINNKKNEEVYQD